MPSSLCLLPPAFVAFKLPQTNLLSEFPDSPIPSIEDSNCSCAH
jgi:hypothetical protein